MSDETVAKGQLQGLQALRGIAALAVVAHHAIEQSDGAAGRFSPDWFTTLGAAGVDLFFVISGFIMLWTSFPHGREPLKPGTFLVRRITRIMPLYWLACAAVLALAAAGFLKSHHYGAATIARSLLLLPGSGVIGVAWTLVFEIWFYVLFALLLPWRSRWMMALGVPALLLIAATLAPMLPPGPTRDLLQSPLPLEFCFGLWAALLAPRLLKRTWPRWAMAALGMLAVTAMALAAWLVPHADTHGLPHGSRALAWGLPALALVLAVLPLRQARGPMMQAIVRLGDSSYALYLSHVFVMTAYGRLLREPAFGSLPQAPVVVAVVALSVAVGFAVHFGIERPMTEWLRSVGQRPRRPTTTHPTTLAPARLEVLDGMRGIAAIVVLVFHLRQQHTLESMAYAPLAVDFFYVLSGYVVALAYGKRLASRAVTPAGFGLVRLRRLYPLAFFGTMLGIGLAAMAALKGSVSLADVALAGGLALLLLPSPVFPQWPTAYPFNMAAWSLAFEAFANAVYALIAPRLTTLRLIALVAVSLGGLALLACAQGSIGGGNNRANFGWGFVRVMFPFFAGVLLQRLRAGPVTGPLMAYGLIAVLGAFLLAGFEKDWLLSLAYVALLFPALVWFGAQSRPSLRLAALCRWTGALSYPLYITQGPVLRAGEEVLKHVQFSPAGAIGFAVAEAAAAVAVALLASRYMDDAGRRVIDRIAAWRIRSPARA